MPVPVRVAFLPVIQLAQPLGFNGTLTVPVFAPSDSGLKAMFIVQPTPPCTGPFDMEQVPPTRENSVASTPLIVIVPKTAMVDAGPVTASTNMV